VGERYLVTVHGPLGSNVTLEDAMRVTTATRERIEDGRFLPNNPPELGHGLVSAMILHLETLVSTIADRVAVLERSIVRGERGNPEEMVERLYSFRHQLLLIRTAASLSRDVYAGRETVARSTVPPERLAIIHDLVDQYAHLTSLCDSEKAFLDQVLDFYQARTVTKMNIAMQRLALIAAILLPISAISGVYGMNVIVNSETDFPHVGGVLILMGAIVALMLRWTKRQGWW
jgi:Mg2+ and Co2+ transporter CorA